MNYLNLLSGTTDFMRLAGQLGEPEFSPLLAEKTRQLRRTLLAEEMQEYRDAEFRNDRVEVVDGLLDVIVVAWGTLLAYVGEEKAKAAANEVVRSNLAKVIDGVKLRGDGKVIKPEGWQAPDIAGAIA